MSEISEIYADKEKCIADILLAREMFGNKNSSALQYAQCEKSLSLMYLYCPEDLVPAVMATLQELDRRRTLICKYNPDFNKQAEEIELKG